MDHILINRKKIYFYVIKRFVQKVEKKIQYGKDLTEAVHKLLLRKNSAYMAFYKIKEMRNKTGFNNHMLLASKNMGSVLDKMFSELMKSYFGSLSFEFQTEKIKESTAKIRKSMMFPTDILSISKSFGMIAGEVSKSDDGTIGDIIEANNSDKLSADFQLPLSSISEIEKDRKKGFLGDSTVSRYESVDNSKKSPDRLKGNFLTATTSPATECVNMNPLSQIPTNQSSPLMTKESKPINNEYATMSQQALKFDTKTSLQTSQDLAQSSKKPKLTIKPKINKSVTNTGRKKDISSNIPTSLNSKTELSEKVDKSEASSIKPEKTEKVAKANPNVRNSANYGKSLKTFSQQSSGQKTGSKKSGTVFQNDKKF